MAPNIIELWQGNSLADDSHYVAYWNVLDEAEKIRARRFTQPTHHKEYVSINAQVRYLLAKIVNQAPEHINIKRTPQGKPYLVEYPNIAFNLSHTHEYFLLAISENCNLGVDIEYCKSRPNMEGLVNKCFAITERDYWYTFSQQDQLSVFYEFWTRKEAFVKATGDGIVLGLEQCVIDVNNPKCFMSIPKQCGNTTDWFIHDVDVAKNYCAALVLDQPITDIRLSYTGNFKHNLR